MYMREGTVCVREMLCACEREEDSWGGCERLEVSVFLCVAGGALGSSACKPACTRPSVCPAVWAGSSMCDRDPVCVRRV